MSELLKGEEWLDLYRPRESASAFEKVKPLDQFTGFTEYSKVPFIVGSGSPRCGRYPETLPGRHVTQLTSSGIARLFSEVYIPVEYRASVREILQYREPRGAWINGGDSNISLNKARLTAAAVLIHAVAQGQNIPPFMVLGRDYNIADSNGRFTDRPGFAMPPDFPEDKLPQGWTTKVDGEKEPESPPEQFHRLYKDGTHFLSANSTTLLRVDQRMASPALVNRLIDLQLPADELNYSTELTFMGLKPEGKLHIGTRIHEFINYYASLSIGEGGEILYLVPGGIDWSRPPFRNDLFVWAGQNGFIGRNFQQLQKEIREGVGSWQKFNDSVAGSKFIEDELVGASTYAVHSLVQ